MTNLFLSFLEISLSGSLIVAALILLTPFFNKRYAAKWKYLIWIFLALRLLVPFNGTDKQAVTDMSINGSTQIEKQTMPEEGEKKTAIPKDAAMPNGKVIVEIPKQMTTPILQQSETGNTGITILNLAALAWMIGGLLFLSLHLISYVRYRHQLMKAGSMIKDRYILGQIGSLKQELHIKRSIQAMEYSEAGSPMIIGFLRPVLVLPKEQYSSLELFFILKHELVHLKRGDVYFKLLFVAANAVHWFNPLIWMMQREAVVDMELSCDERVTQGANYDAKKAYTETLLSLLHRGCVRKTVLSTQFYGGTKVMKKRFANILITKRKKNGAVILLCAILLTVSLGTLAGCSLVTGREEKVPAPLDTENTPPKETKDENINWEQMAGRWVIDFDLTENIWGAEIYFGNSMLLSDTGGLGYYIGIGAWNIAQCEGKGSVITAETQPDSETLTLEYSNDNGVEHILMKQNEGTVYWKRADSSTDVRTTQGEEICGYITGWFDDGSVAVDQQFWVTRESEQWRAEYDQMAGFEVVDAGDEDVVYPFHEECAYFILENHWTPIKKITKKEFRSYSSAAEYPILWNFVLEDGRIIIIYERYVP